MKFVLKSSQMYIFNVHVSIDINCLLTNTSRWRLSYLDLLLEFSASTCFSAFSIQSYWMARRGARDVKNEKSNIFFPTKRSWRPAQLGQDPTYIYGFRSQPVRSLICIVHVERWKCRVTLYTSGSALENVRFDLDIADPAGFLQSLSIWGSPGGPSGLAPLGVFFKNEKIYESHFGTFSQ